MIHKQTVQALFALGMKFQLPELIPAPLGEITLNLGAGKSLMPNAWNLDYPDWDARKGELGFADGTIGAIYAFHFFEHLSGEDAIRMLRECERVLRPGGILTTVTPHRLGSMAFHDLDHKSFWTEDTWKTLLGTPWYDKNREVPWRLKLHFNMIAGISERNLCLMSQLIKGG